MIFLISSYIIFAALGTIGCLIDTLWDFDRFDEANWIEFIFHTQIWIKDQLDIDDGLNLTGKVILILLTSLFIFPGNLALLSIKLVILLFSVIRKCYVWIFAKRK